MAGSKQPHATEAVRRPAAGAHDDDAHQAQQQQHTGKAESPPSVSARRGGPSSGGSRDWGYSQLRVLALGAVLLLAIAMGASKATHKVTDLFHGRSRSDKMTDAFTDESNSWRDSLNAVADQMRSTKDEGMRKVLETYHEAATSAGLEKDDSWTAQYDRAYRSAKDQASRIAGRKTREDSVSDKLKSAYASMQEQMGLAQTDYQKSYDEIVNDSVEGLKRKMESGLSEVSKQYKKGKISAKEATKLIEEKTKEARDNAFVDTSDKSISDRLKKAYEDLNKKTRDARSSYVKAYDDSYYGGKSYAQRVKDAAASAGDTVRDAANDAYDTVTGLPDSAQRQASRAYHGARAAGYNAEGKLKSGVGAAEAKVGEEYHRGKMHQREAEDEASGVLGSVKSGARSAATSVRDAGRSASQACYDAVWDTKTQFDVAYEQAVDYLSDTAESIKETVTP